jgi:hypothetical protein
MDDLQPLNDRTAMGIEERLQAGLVLRKRECRRHRRHGAGQEPFDNAPRPSRHAAPLQPREV